MKTSLAKRRRRTPVKTMSRCTCPDRVRQERRHQPELPQLPSAAKHLPSPRNLLTRKRLPNQLKVALLQLSLPRSPNLPLLPQLPRPPRRAEEGQRNELPLTRNEMRRNTVYVKYAFFSITQIPANSRVDGRNWKPQPISSILLLARWNSEWLFSLCY